MERYHQIHTCSVLTNHFMFGHQSIQGKVYTIKIMYLVGFHENGWIRYFFDRINNLHRNIGSMSGSDISDYPEKLLEAKHEERRVRKEIWSTH